MLNHLISRPVLYKGILAAIFLFYHLKSGSVQKTFFGYPRQFYIWMVTIFDHWKTRLFTSGFWMVRFLNGSEFRARDYAVSDNLRTGLVRFWIPIVFMTSCEQKDPKLDLCSASSAFRRFNMLTNRMVECFGCLHIWNILFVSVRQWNRLFTFFTRGFTELGLHGKLKNGVAELVNALFCGSQGSNLDKNIFFTLKNCL